MRTEKAISDLAEIRLRLQMIDARAAFRCFSLLISAFVFVIAAFAQPIMGQTVDGGQRYVSYWLVVVLACSIGIALEVWWRSVSTRSRITFEWSRQIATAMLPVLSVAALTTWAMMSEPQLAKMLPGFWAIFAGLAVISAGKLLPSICQLACVWWIIGGALTIRLHELFAENLVLTMSLLFGAGQLLLAICLFAGVSARDEA